MSEYCAIDITLNAEYAQDNILNILQKGHQHGFVYRDPMNDWALINDVPAAAKIVMLAFNNKISGGACVFAKLDRESDATIWFYKDLNNYLEVHIGAFGGAQEKEGHVDLGYYIPFFLELCKDFIILKVEARLFE